MDPILISIVIFISVITLIKYLEHDFCISSLKYGRQIVSFIVGASIVTIFAELLNDIYTEVHSTNNLLVLLLPLSFIILMFIEQHVHKHIKKSKKNKELSSLLKWISFFSGLVVGMIAINNPQPTLFKEIIFLLVIGSYDLIREISFHLVQEGGHGAHFKRVLLSLSPFYGFALAFYLPIPEVLNVAILTVFGGALTYFMVREIVLPQEERIRPIFFSLGFLTMTAIFLVNFIA